MTARIRIQLNCEMPEEYLARFLQHIRDFDVENDGCGFAIFAMGDIKAEDMEAILDGIDPPFTHRDFQKKN